MTDTGDLDELRALTAQLGHTQQADILIVRDNRKINAIADLLPEMPWLREAPVFLVFLANGGRLPKVSIQGSAQSA